MFRLFVKFALLKFLYINALSSNIENESLQRWKNGEESPFKALYYKYFDALLHIAYNKIKVFSALEEIVHDTFLGFYNRKMNVSEQLHCYIKGILMHNILDYFRRMMLQFIILLNEDYQTSLLSDSNILEDITARVTQLVLDNPINKLPSQCRNVFLLLREADLSDREISEKLGISVKAVEKHIIKALRCISQHLDYHLSWLIVAGVIALLLQFVY